MSTNLNALQLAFAYDMIQRIIGSDTVVDSVELSFLDDTFPPDLLRTCGFIDARGRLTEAFTEARAEALEALPAGLTQGQKLALLDLLIEAAASDGVLAAEEADLLSEAAALLSLSDLAWREHLTSLLATGKIRRGDAGIE
ncbi:MAG TPA: hypothetical protein ENK18_07525 [Deltaproteobacteria bacterium]|nr:hypothetical protein [Deltaproteobacteria bacterium]